MDPLSKQKIPEELAAKLEAARASHSMQGERRIVTILFCDVTGSTAMAEQLDPEDWAEIMDDAFDYLIAPIYRYEGTVARLMGDAILAFFGAPIAHEDDPQRAILAGMDIVSGIQPFKEKVTREFNLDFNVRVGINTGEVVVGEIGSDLAVEYTAMGDAVNLAARMEQTARPGSVQIAENTYRLVAPLFEFEELGEIEVKGKSEPVQAYRAISRKEQPGRLRGIAGLETPLVGRDQEVELLHLALSNLRQGRGEILNLIGEAGLGKSRLIEELQKEVTSQVGEPVYWYETRGVSYETSRPYGLFQQHFRQFHGVTDEDPREVVIEKVASMIQGQAPETVDLFNKVVEMLLGVQKETTQTTQHGEAFKHELFDAVFKLIASIASNLPMVMVFDDLHWADKSSIELLLHLFKLADQVPVLFLCAFRPYRFSPGWQVKQAAEVEFPHRYTEIVLSPLSDTENATLVDSLLKISNLPPELRQLIFKKAEGNPFFTEEVIRTLIDHGIIQRDETGLRWIATTNVEEIHIPDSLQAMLISRIDRLEVESRRTLQLASVIGRTFFYRILQTVSEARQALDQQLNNLQRVELIREQTRLPDLKYIFVHELTRDAAYQSILHRQRRKFHLKVGEAIEGIYADRLEEEAPRLAYHFSEAKDHQRALKYYRLAGDHAARLFANQEAISHYRHAIEIARRINTPNQELSYLFSRLGRTLEVSGQYDEALQTYQELWDLGQSLQDPGLELAALIPQATIHSIPSVKLNAEKGRSLSEQALTLARQVQDHRSEARALWNLMLVDNYSTRNLDKALEYGEQALEIARNYELEEDLAYILHDLTRTYMDLGRWQDAWAALNEAQQFWRETSNQAMLADNLGMTAGGFQMMGEIENAIHAAQDGLSLSQSVGSLWGQAFNLFVLSPLYFEIGNIDQAIQALEDAFPLARQANFTAPILSGQVILAWIHAELGNLEEEVRLSEADFAGVEDQANYKPYFVLLQAREQIRSGRPAESLETIKEQEIEEFVLSDQAFFTFTPLLLYMFCEILLANQQSERVSSYCEKMIDRMLAIKMRLFLPDMYHMQSLAFAQMGQTERALQILANARQESKTQNSRRSLVKILSTMIQLGRERGEAGTEAELLQEARQTIEYIASHISSPELRASFLNQDPVKELMSSGG